MKITKFCFENFRNLKKGEIVPGEGFNVIYGDNAQGKTNLMESMWLFTGGRSFRGAKDKDLIQFENKNVRATLEMDFLSEGREQKAKITIDKDKKSKRNLILNGVNKASTTDIIGKFCAVVFSPVHLSLIKEGPNFRRRFIDAAVCQIKPSYIYVLSKFNRALIQRNTLLKDIRHNPQLMETLQVWNKGFSETGSRIIFERKEYCKRLREYSGEVYKGIASLKEEMDLKYETTVTSNSVEGIERELEAQLEEKINQDIYSGFTSVGPHRDDMEILIDKVSAKFFASQGQQRSAVLALKLSEAKVLKSVIGENPIIFLDDVMSELDLSRQSYLSSNVEGFQTFITCCDPSILKAAEGIKFFEMNIGEIIK